MNDQQRAIVRSAADMSLVELTTVADLLGQSGYFKGVENKAQAVAKVMAGAELGIPPFAAMSGIHIIEGKVVMGSTLMAGCIRKSGVYDYRVEEINNEVCRLGLYASDQKGGWNSIGVSSFTMQDAAAAGLAGKPVWKSYARNMLFARALSNGIRWYAPDLFLGMPVYTAEELDAPSGEDGGYIEASMVTTAAVGDWWERFAEGVKAAGYDRDRVAWALGCTVDTIRTTARAWLTEQATADPAGDVDALLALIAEGPTETAHAETEAVPAVVEAEVVEPKPAPARDLRDPAKPSGDWWLMLMSAASKRKITNKQIAALVTGPDGADMKTAARLFLNERTSGEDTAADIAYLLDNAAGL